jgi:UrcA family protein
MTAFAYDLCNGGKRHGVLTGRDTTADRGRQVRETFLKQYLIGALALAMAIPAAAQAGAALDATKVVSVRHNDLDLSQSKDARVMMRRLDRAALAACNATGFSARAYREVVRRSSCYQHSMDSAVASLGAPTVSALRHGAGSISIASN